MSDEKTCGYAAANGHLEMLRRVLRRVLPNFGSDLPSLDGRQNWRCFKVTGFTTSLLNLAVRCFPPESPNSQHPSHLDRGQKDITKNTLPLVEKHVTPSRHYILDELHLPLSQT